MAEINSKDLALYFLFMLTGMLSKLPVAFIGIVFLVFSSDKTIALKAKSHFFCFICHVCLAIVSTYYFYWVPYLRKYFWFFSFFYGRRYTAGMKEIIAHLGEASQRFYSDAMKYAGFLLFLFRSFCCLP